MKDDGQNGNYEKERQELLDRFRKALANPDGGEASQWFDEDDLLDVFDYAGDIGNDYLRAEALLWGARYFPDSQRLKERRGVFYSDVLSDSDVEAFTADNGEVTTLLTELLSLRARPLTGEQVREQLIELTGLRKILTAFAPRPNIFPRCCTKLAARLLVAEGPRWPLRFFTALLRRLRTMPTSGRPLHAPSLP